VIVSGDLTQRAHIPEFMAAQAFLTALRAAHIEYFVIPGNHDIRPIHHPLARALKPFDRYREFISDDTEPRYRDEEIAIASIDTVRAGKIANGTISTAQIAKVEEWFATLGESVIRIVVTHHPLDLPRARRPRPLVGRAKRAVYGLAESNVDLYLAGHYHHSSAIVMSERYRRLTAPSIAVQAGTLSSRERGETQSFNTIFIDGSNIRVETSLLAGPRDRFVVEGVYRFIREGGVWRMA
jgi:3',5'-cyclic AMP phosphodiesterase CpdA